MAYIRKHARFTILDNVPCDVWEEHEVSDPENYTLLTPYLCIVDEEPADYHGNFTACTFTAALFQGEHVPVSGKYLRDRCTLAPEPIARKILAFYLRNWATMEDDDTAELLRDAAEEIARKD